ncbi:hypothetical protein WDW86_13700, partial [Bdellovibrionota bacterium FG-2]
GLLSFVCGTYTRKMLRPWHGARLSFSSSIRQEQQLLLFLIGSPPFLMGRSGVTQICPWVGGRSIYSAWFGGSDQSNISAEQRCPPTR